MSVGMEDVHRRAIQNNFISLVETTDLDSMVIALYEKGVFSEQMIEPYKDTAVPQRDRKRNLYLDIKRRGPLAFGNLLEVLKELGYWDLVRDLDPNSPLHLRPNRTINASTKPTSIVENGNTYISISDQRHKTKSESEPSKNVFASASGPASSSANNNEEAIPFEVTKSTKFIADNESKDIKLYRTRGKNRGVLILFTYISFKHNIENYRKGVEVDCTNLRYLFAEMGFKVRSYKDLTLEETRETLRILKEVLVGYESVFVVLSSHGYERAGSSDTDVRCSDGGLLSLREFFSYFSNQCLPQLVHVPKVFILQMCRGASTDYVNVVSKKPSQPAHLSMPETDGTPIQPGSEPPALGEELLSPSRKALYSNILIAQSTLPGFVSRRDEQQGSWYIQVLCEVFAARAHDTHVDELFTLVDKRLAERFEIQTSSVDRWGFNKRLYLHPGLNEPL